MEHDSYRLVEQSLYRIAAADGDLPSLTELAEEAGLSAFHFQRVFKDWAGVSPKKFMQHVTLEAAKERLRACESVMDAAFGAGLSGPSRLHDLMVSIEAMTPGEYRKGGAGLTIRYGVHETPFGPCAIGITDRGICGLSFGASSDEALDDLMGRWPKAKFRGCDDETAVLVEQIFEENVQNTPGRLRVHVPATPFQLQVWRALLAIPSGSVTTYGRIAQALGLQGQASRAVGQAIGANPVGYLIPCHRVLRRTGAVSGYRWGTGRKLSMLGYEAVRTDATPPSEDLVQMRTQIAD